MGYDEKYLGELIKRETQYHIANNWRRQRYHAKFDVKYVPLKYDVSLARDSENWAYDLLADCSGQGT